MSQDKPTVIKIVRESADDFDDIDYEIVENNSGIGYEAKTYITDEGRTGFTIPEGLTEAEIEDGECIRGDVQWLYIEDGWFKSCGEGSAAFSDSWRESTLEGIAELPEPLDNDTVLHVHTEYWGDGAYCNVVEKVSVPE